MRNDPACRLNQCVIWQKIVCDRAVFCKPHFGESIILCCPLQHMPIIFEKAIKIEVCPISVIIFCMASLDSFQLHTEFFHQADGLYVIDGFSKYFVCKSFTSSIV